MLTEDVFEACRVWAEAHAHSIDISNDEVGCVAVMAVRLHELHARNTVLAAELASLHYIALRI